MQMTLMAAFRSKQSEMTPVENATFVHYLVLRKSSQTAEFLKAQDRSKSQNLRLRI